LFVRNAVNRFPTTITSFLITPANSVIIGNALSAL